MNEFICVDFFVPSLCYSFISMESDRMDSTHIFQWHVFISVSVVRRRMVAADSLFNLFSIPRRNCKYQSESVYRITIGCETMIQTHKNVEHISTKYTQNEHKKKTPRHHQCKLNRNNKTAAIFKIKKKKQIWPVAEQQKKTPK